MLKIKKHFIITAGPTCEPIDPIRVITNRSTGLMGHELAKAAIKRGHQVTLITGPVKLEPPEKTKVIRVETAREMGKAVLKEIKKADCIIMAAAVADYSLKKTRGQKIKDKKTLTLKFERTDDIIRGINKKGILKVGFALETEELLKNAKSKLKNKKLDIVVANRYSGSNDPFGYGKKDFIILKKDGRLINIKKSTKGKAARKILDIIEGKQCRTGQH